MRQAGIMEVCSTLSKTVIVSVSEAILLVLTNKRNGFIAFNVQSLGGLLRSSLAMRKKFLLRMAHSPAKGDGSFIPSHPQNALPIRSQSEGGRWLR
jgi:hypothetical protein